MEYADATQKQDNMIIPWSINYSNYLVSTRTTKQILCVGGPRVALH